MNTPIYNPWAPPSLNGFNEDPSSFCQEDDIGYCWPILGGFQVLTANQQLIAQTIPLQRTSDFILRAIHFTYNGGGFLIRIVDERGQHISDSPIYSYNMPGSLTIPFPIFPHVTYPSGNLIQFDIINVDAAPQNVQLVFRGAKRFQRAA